MSKLSYVLLLVSVGAASTQLAQAHSESHPVRSQIQRGAPASLTPETTAVPTVVVPVGAPVAVPTVSIPKPGHHRQAKKRPTPTRTPAPAYAWLTAFLTSYCPGAAGWISSSGLPVFYGMLANDYYPFGTRVYMPVLGMTGVVEDRFGGAMGSMYFDVWSPICYGTPTGWFKVAIVR